MGSPEERPIAEWMNPYIDLYLNEARPVLLKRAKVPTIAVRQLSLLAANSCRSRLRKARETISFEASEL